MFWLHILLVRTDQRSRAAVSGAICTLHWCLHRGKIELQVRCKASTLPWSVEKYGHWLAAVTPLYTVRDRSCQRTDELQNQPGVTGLATRVMRLRRYSKHHSNMWKLVRCIAWDVLRLDHALAALLTCRPGQLARLTIEKLLKSIKLWTAALFRGVPKANLSHYHGLPMWKSGPFLCAAKGWLSNACSQSLTVQLSPLNRAILMAPTVEGRSLS